VGLVGGVDVVLEQDRDPVQRPAHLAALTLVVERFSDRLRVRVDLDDRMEPGIELPDAFDVAAGDFARRCAMRMHGGLQLANTDLDKFADVSVVSRIRRGLRVHRRRRDQLAKCWPCRGRQGREAQHRAPADLPESVRVEGIFAL
jgi:hypothetical protein